MSSSANKLHWTQRVALVRHNLHTASRSGDFKFFKALQAAGFLEGTNHVATLSAEFGDDADVVLAAMDNLNAGLAYVHQDAFKNVYDNLKDNARDSDKEGDRSKLFVDIAMQKNMADMAIDKMTSSALTLINQQQEKMQEGAANVWITGTTIVADCMEVTIRQMDMIEDKLDDFIRLEESYTTVKASVVCAVTGLKGVFHFMDPTNPQDFQKPSTRNSSIASAGGAMFRRLSSAFVAPTASSSRSSSTASTPSVHQRSGSVSSTGPVYRTPNYVRNSVSAGCPTSLPPQFNNNSFFERHKLSMIPPTPAAVSDEQDPFDISVPPVPQMPEIHSLPALPSPTLNVQERMFGQAVV
ncbi:hypothetical protein LTR37_018094 [Vermiconidia calcicola]|uniref:Uncharacterized protein n=1 Tax=Vermiconidia calcicola TaxID=1690605 RepID=A0ACC3MKY8_9PEZI|nr:hypothetical protein LTR37_018094 [Vermiconidia calcicola]